MTTLIQTDTLTVKITPNDAGNPPARPGAARLPSGGGRLAGMMRMGSAIGGRRGGGGRTAPSPARQYSVNGERRSYALLRPVVDTAAQNVVRDLILQAYDEFERSL